MQEAYLMCKRGEKPPEHMANCLYLEWFSEANGRVVIESADYELNISAPEWRMTPEEDAERAKQAAAGMDDFMQKLTEAIEAASARTEGPGSGMGRARLRKIHEGVRRAHGQIHGVAG